MNSNENEEDINEKWTKNEAIDNIHNEMKEFEFQMTVFFPHFQKFAAFILNTSAAEYVQTSN